MTYIDDGQLALTRLKHGRDKLRRYRVEIDNVKVGMIAAGETKAFPLSLDEHQIRLRIDWCASPVKSFRLLPEAPNHELWCCAGSTSHIEDIVVGRNRYIQLGGREDADAMPGPAGFDVRHFALLILVLALVAVVASVLVAVV